MSDLISRKEAIKAIENVPQGNWLNIRYSEEIERLPSVDPWNAVKTLLNELEQKVEKLHADYCDATARLKAISKIAESDQTPNRKIDGIKPLAEMVVEE